MAAILSRPQCVKDYTCIYDIYHEICTTYHYSDVTMGSMTSQITSLTIVYSAVYADADQRKHQSSASLVIVRGIHRRPVNSPHKWPVTRKMFPFDDVIMFVVLCVCGYIVSIIWLMFVHIFQDCLSGVSAVIEPRTVDYLWMQSNSTHVERTQKNANHAHICRDEMQSIVGEDNFYFHNFPTRIISRDVSVDPSFVDWPIRYLTKQIPPNEWACMYWLNFVISKVICKHTYVFTKRLISSGKGDNTIESY